VFGSGILEPEENHAGSIPFRQSYDLAEVQIEGENNSVFSNGLLEDLSVGKCMEMLLSKVLGVVPGLSQPFNNSQGNSHVG